MFHIPHLAKEYYQHPGIPVYNMMYSEEIYENR